MSTLTDDFATQDTAKWTFGSDASVTGGQLVMQCLSSYSSEANSVDSYSLVGSYALMEVVSPQGAGTGTTSTYFLCREIPDVNAVRWLIAGTTLLAEYRVASTNTTVFSAAFDATAHRWLRFREDAGTVYWDTSPDGVVWTNRATWVSTITLTALKVALGSGYYGTESSPAPAVVDNFNLIPAPVVEDQPMIVRRVAPTRR